MEALDVPKTQLKLQAHGGAHGSDLRALLDKARAADPAEPFWTGVRRMADSNGALEVDWHEPVEPRLLPSGDVEVECHLYDEAALAEAAQRRQSRIPE
jgi:peptide/nickel transport system ATP-binding protein